MKSKFNRLSNSPSLINWNIYYAIPYPFTSFYVSDITGTSFKVNWTFAPSRSITTDTYAIADQMIVLQWRLKNSSSWQTKSSINPSATSDVVSQILQYDKEYDVRGALRVNYYQWDPIEIDLLYNGVWSNTTFTTGYK